MNIAPHIIPAIMVISAAILPLTAQATTWPEKPIRMVVPFAPGGNTDSVARIVAAALSNELGKTVLVENLAGASGTIGATHVAKAAPDGYTVLMGTVGTQAINMSLFNRLSEKSLKDFVPVTLVASVPNVLVVNQDLPVKTVADLVAYAKAQPHPIAFASPGVGSSIHLSGEMFKTATQLPMTHVPYRGSAPALTDLVGGQVQFMFDNLPPSLPFIKSGRLKALAVTSAKRSPLLPDVPTMIESGFPNFEIGSWNGIMVPVGTPPEVVSKLNDTLQKITATPEFQDKIQQLGGEAQSVGPQAFSAFVQSEYEKWGGVISAAGISKQ